MFIRKEGAILKCDIVIDTDYDGYISITYLERGDQVLLYCMFMSKCSKYYPPMVYLLLTESWDCTYYR
jgi:hypothetical protein